MTTYNRQPFLKYCELSVHKSVQPLGRLQGTYIRISCFIIWIYIIYNSLHNKVVNYKRFCNKNKDIPLCIWRLTWNYVFCPVRRSKSYDKEKIRNRKLIIFEFLSTLCMYLGGWVYKRGLGNDWDKILSKNTRKE